MQNSIPRSEYPRPSLRRDEWINLNGRWDFEIDNDMCGEDARFYERKSLSGSITVPFCPESRLSGDRKYGFYARCVVSERHIHT